MVEYKYEVPEESRVIDFDLRYKLLQEDAKPPIKAHVQDLGWDLFSNENIVIPSFSRELVRTGIAIGFPNNVGGILKDRSGLSSKKGLFIHAGVIDPGYTGEIRVLMFNSSRSPIEIGKHDKIAQMILMPVFQVTNLIEVPSLEETERGAHGFGSTGT